MNSWGKACRPAVLVLNWNTGTAELLVDEDCCLDGRKWASFGGYVPIQSHEDWTAESPRRCQKTDRFFQAQPRCY